MNSNSLSEIGKLFPYIYLEKLADDLHGVLHRWLIKKGAPYDLVEAISDVVLLMQYAHWKETKKIEILDEDNIPVLVVNALKHIERFEGTDIWIRTE